MREKTFFLFFLALLRISASQTDDEKKKQELNDHTLKEYLSELPAERRTKTLLPCADNTVTEIGKIISEGENAVKNAKGKYAFVMTGFKPSEKGLLANFISGLDLDEKPKRDINSYPRLTAEDSSANFYEAPTLNEGSVAAQAAGAYFMTEAIKEAEGVQLIFAYSVTGLPDVFEYFQAIAKANPHLGIHGLRESECFVVTNFTDIQSQKGFGNNPFLLLSREALKDKKKRDTNLKYLKIMLSYSVFVNVLKFPIMQEYKECVKSKVDEQIVQDLKKGTAGLLKHLQDIEGNKTMTDSKKVQIIGNALSNLTAIKNHATREMTPDAITKPLAEYLTTFNFKTDANQIKKINDYSKILITVRDDYETQAWEIGLEPLLKYLKSAKNQFEVKSTLGEDTFDCKNPKQQAVVKQALYELNYEKATRPNSSEESIIATFSRINSMIRGDIVEMYEAKAGNKAEENDFIDVIYAKLQSFHGKKCDILGEDQETSCDSEKSKELADLIEKGSEFSETERQDQIILIVGTKSEEQNSVAYLLAGQQIPPSNDTELSPIYPQFIIDPLNTSYSIFTAPNIKKDKPDVEETATNYFATILLNGAIASKVIVTISEKAIKEKENFKLIMDSAAKFLFGVSKAWVSLGFIVTDAAIEDNGKIDEKLKTVTNDLMTAIEGHVKGVEDKETKEVLESFLTMKNVTTKQIGIIPASKKLEGENSFQSFSEHVKTVIDSGVKFSPYIDKNYLEMLSDKNKGLAECAAKVVEKRVSERLSLITEQFKDLIREWEKEPDLQYKTLFDKIDESVGALTSALQKVTASEQVSGMFNPIATYMMELQLEFPVTLTVCLQSYARYLLNSVASFSHAVNNGFIGITLHISNARRWYYFLGKVESEFSRYAVVKDAEKYQKLAQDLQAKIRTGSAEIEDVDAFIDEIESAPGEALKKLHGEFTPNLSKFNYFGFIIERIFVTPLGVTCSDGITTCGAPYVVLSRCLELKCPNSRHTEVQGSAAAFIDIDWNEPGGALAIIAPKWYIIGNRTVHLNGEEPSSDPGSANDGITNEAPGSKGKPGAAGNAGGCFLGVGEFCDNGEGSGSLSISANGGRGGPGQRGGNGGEAKDPEPPEAPWDVYSVKNYAASGFEEERERRAGGSTVTDIYLKAASGTPGKGGDGGKGGNGGIPGIITVVFLGQGEVAIERSAKPGEEGRHGEGGSAGPSKVQKFEVTEERVKWAFDKQTYRYRVYPLEIERIYGQEGNGKTGSNEEGIKPPKPSEVQPNFAETMNRYKYFFREISSKRSRFFQRVGFERDMTNNRELFKFYDTATIADDFRKLESQVYTLKKTRTVIPYYENIIDAINTFTQNGTVNDEEKKVLAYIYSAVLSKLAAERNKETFLVINLPGYLSSIHEEIEQLKKLDNDQVAKSYQKDYKNNVESKIKEAQSLIDNEVLPYIKKYEDGLTEQISAVITDIVERKKQNRLEKVKLQEQQKILKKNAFIRKIMSGVNCLVSMTAFLGPTAAAVGGALSAGARILDATLLSSEPGDAAAKLAAIPAAVNGQLVTVIALLENKKSAFTDQLGDISKRLDKIGGKDNKDISKIQDKVTFTKGELAKIDPKKLDPNSVKKMNELKSGLGKTMQESKNTIVAAQANDDKIDKRIANIGRLQTVLSMGDQMARDYQAIKASDDKLDQCGQALKENDINLEKLEAYETSVYTDMLPMVNGIVDRLDGIADENKGKSHAALDVSKWKTEEYLSDMKITLAKMTEGFDSSEEFRKIITKVEGGIRTMMQLFDRIQDQQDKSELAVFLGDLNSNGASSVKVKDPLLNEIINDVQIAIQRNIILQKFDLCYKAFMYSLFPFGSELFQDFSIPPKISGSNATDSLVGYAIQRIRQMVNKIQTTQTTISTYDNDIHNDAYFVGDEDGLDPPFYEWPYETHAETLQSLFRGETIRLHADITKLEEEIRHRNAIKYNIVRVALIPRDEKVKASLDKALNGVRFDLTFLGSAHYKCGEKFYTMSTNPFTINYSYKLERDSEVTPKSGNDVYKKIKINTAMFSPYGRWNLTIDATKIKKKFKSFIGEPIDMKFVGKGFYVDDDSDICDQDLDLLYQRDRSLVPDYILSEDDEEEDDDDDE